MNEKRFKKVNEHSKKPENHSAIIKKDTAIKLMETKKFIQIHMSKNEQNNHYHVTWKK